MGWGRSLQRLWSVCMEGVQMLHRPLKSHASCGSRRHSELRYLPNLKQLIPSNPLNRATSIPEVQQTKPRMCVIVFADVDTSPR